MIVVSDTSAVSNLLQIHAGHLLVDLFGEVLIPPAVETELRRFHPSLPAFLSRRAPSDTRLVEQLGEKVDTGEAEAIALAKELRADWLLIDEKPGRRVARQEGVAILGLGGLLLMAKRQRLIETIAPLLTRLERDAGFFLGDDVKAELLSRAGESAPSPPA